MRHRSACTALALSLSLAAGCGENAAANKPAAVTGPAQPVAPSATATAEPAAAGEAPALTAPAETAAAPAATAPASANALAFSNANGSKIQFVGSKTVGGSHDGGFNVFQGAFELAGDKPEVVRISADIDMDSTYSDAEKLTAHLKNEDFFDVPKFPRSSFVTTEIKAGGENGASHTVTGNLTLHGVTKSITFPATITVSDAEVQLVSEFSIKRGEFGITFSGPGGVIRDEVLLKLDVKAPRKQG